MEIKSFLTLIERGLIAADAFYYDGPPPSDQLLAENVISLAIHRSPEGLTLVVRRDDGSTDIVSGLGARHRTGEPEHLILSKAQASFLKGCLGGTAQA